MSAADAEFAVSCDGGWCSDEHVGIDPSAVTAKDESGVDVLDGGAVLQPLAKFMKEGSSGCREWLVSINY